MSNKTKKDEEFRSLQAFWSICRHALVKTLHDCSNVSEPKQERPDFVFVDVKCAYGIEHIHIPICKEGEGDADYVQRARERDTFYRYIVDEEKGINKLEGHEEEARAGIETIVNGKLKAISKTSYDEYMNTCQSLLKKHNATVYRQNVSERFPTKDCKICFLLDITHPEIVRELKYRRRGSNHFEQNVRRDYPFTFGFLDILRKNAGVDYYFLIWHPDRTYNPKETRAYLLDSKKNWKEQSLPTIWERFEFPDVFFHPWKVKLTVEKDEG